MKKIRILLTAWDESLGLDKIEHFKKRYSMIDPDRYEFVPFYYSDFFSSDRLGRIPKELLNSIGVDRMYRGEDPRYMQMLEAFKTKISDVKIVMFSTFCAFHPNFLYHECKDVVKILPAIDDPPASFERTVPYIYAMDACTHVSLSYNNQTRMEEQLKIWGARKTYFTPIGANHLNRTDNLSVASLEHRPIDLIYVGGMYPTKIDRFTYLKRTFGSRFRLYGRWRPLGLRGTLYTLVHFRRHQFFPWRVRSLPPDRLAYTYRQAKVGINMHWGNAETGNSRLYELPANGVMQICDRGAGNATAELFEEDREIILYDTMEEAVDKIRYYLEHEQKRKKIAMAGYERVQRDYRQEEIYRRLFEQVVKDFDL